MSAAEGSYIGPGVLREFLEEYSLPLATRGSAGSSSAMMPRSHTMGELSSLAGLSGGSSAADVRGWRPQPVVRGASGGGLRLALPTPGTDVDETPRDTTSDAASATEEGGDDGVGLGISLDIADDTSSHSVQAAAVPGSGRQMLRAATSPTSILTAASLAARRASSSSSPSHAAAAPTPPGAAVSAAAGSLSWRSGSGGGGAELGLPPLAPSAGGGGLSHASEAPILSRSGASAGSLSSAASHLAGGASAGSLSAATGLRKPPSGQGLAAGTLTSPLIAAVAMHGPADVTTAVGKPVLVRVAGPAASALLVPGAGGGMAAPATLTNRQASLRREGKLVLSMVGLPARGKTAIARLLRRHLTWQGYKTEIFNVGNYRRKLLGANQPAAFFDPTNAAGNDARREMAELALEDLVSALADDTLDIGIFDATNTTSERRRWLRRALDEAGARLGMRFQLVFIESICGDEEIIRSNVQETKLKMPDYRDTDAAAAVQDFLQRIQFYADAYEPISDAAEGAMPYIKLIDVGRQIIANRINGNLNSRIMFFLSNLHITPRPIWLSRHGESEFNVQGRIGGDSMLSPRGYAYALKLGAFMRAQYPESDAGGAGSTSGEESAPLVVWTSLLRRTVATAATIGREIIRWNELNEIDAGVCDGMTYEQIATTMPDEYAARGKNKYRYRYPRGESYEDIAQRLEPVIIELMRTKSPVLIVSHQATLRVLYAYLTDKSPESCPECLIPLHTVIQLTPRAYGVEEVRHSMECSS